MINKKVLSAILLVFCVTFSAFAALQFARAQTIPCTVYVDPEYTTVHVCNNFMINVNIADVTEPSIHDYDFFLIYDSSMMTPVNAWDGGFLMPPLGNFFWEVVSVSTGMDAVHCLAVTQDGGATGSGTLATIEFHCDRVGDSPLNLNVMLSDASGVQYPPSKVVGGFIHQYWIWEPVKLIDIVEWPYPYFMADIPFILPGSPEGYHEVLTYLEDKGYTFDVNDGTASEITMFIEEEEMSGNVTSWWSSNTLEDGTRACMLSCEMQDGSSMAMGFVTNLLPPEQIPEVDPYIIVNAQPYLFVRFYWWAWNPIGRVVSWSYWWYDSHSHKNWFWGPYWWWRIYTRSYYYPYIDVPYWRPWWGWWWHWTYWRHWHWWCTYFPYDP